MIYVVSPKVPKDLRKVVDIENSVIYACDSAVEELIKQGIRIDLAIGDFDSLNDKSLLKDIKVITLSKMKDDSDTAYALRHAYQHSDNVILVGGLQGKRIDHLVANLLLLEKYPELTIIDDMNKINRLEKGIYNIKRTHFKYLSIFPFEDSTITLEGTLYPLDHEKLFMYDVIGLSNEFIRDDVLLEVHEGTILLILSNEK